MLASITVTSIDINDQILDVILRILVAAICGFAVGYERKTRSKEVGIRTHTIVAMASALLMIVSKYGFSDLTGSILGTDGADPARIAAQIVSGIGFLGAGIIIYRRDMLHGLTTAAGVWMTAAIGMAIGAGMYIIGAASTVILVLLQVLLHSPLKIFRTRIVTVLKMTVKMNDDTVEKIKQIFEVKKFLKFQTMTAPDGTISASIELTTDMTISEDEIYRITKDNDFILQIEKTDEI